MDEKYKEALDLLVEAMDNLRYGHEIVVEEDWVKKVWELLDSENLIPQQWIEDEKS